MLRPFAKFFNVIQCGGEGEGMYIAAARGPQAVSPSTRTPTDKDYELGGRMQGTLRMIAQKEAMNRKGLKAGQEEAERIGTTGQPVNSLAVRA